MLFTGLGVFRLYFSFDWTTGDEAGQLFAFSIRGGQSLNIFEAAPFGRVFWISQCLLVALCVLMPFFRIAGAVVLSVVAAVGVTFLHLQYPLSPSGTPLEFELLTVLILTSVYVLLSYLGSRRDQVKIAALLSKYVPEEVSQQYQRDANAVPEAGEERDISVLFCDVREFSVVARDIDSRKLAQWLNLYFGFVSKIVIRHRGSIDKYMGDSVMAVWGAPVTSTTHAFDALRTALEIQSELHELNAQYTALGLPQITVGIGISTGPAMVGPLGSEYRMDYTVIGDTVNVAQRLEGQTRKYEVPVVVSDKTMENVPDMLCRELDTVSVKGRVEPVTMYQPLCMIDDASDGLLEQLEMHERAMAATADAQWEEAVELFTELRDVWGPGKMYELYLRGIEIARRD